MCLAATLLKNCRDNFLEQLVHPRAVLTAQAGNNVRFRVCKEPVMQGDCNQLSCANFIFYHEVRQKRDAAIYGIIFQ